MSTFQETEVSPDNGRPFELYLFVYGPNATDHYAYTNAVRPITRAIDGRGDVEFTPIPISRQAYKSNGRVDPQNMNISTPVTSDLARLFLDFPPTQTVVCTIFQGHFGMLNADYPVVWVGKVLSSSRERNQQVLTCSSTIASMKRVGNRRNYQYGCPHVLYGPECKANKEAASYPAKVAAYGRNYLTFVSGWNGDRPIEKFLGGMIYWTSELGDEYRSIVRVQGDMIYFAGPVRGIAEGDDVTVILGCNHQHEDCNGLHANILNYGGQPWIPLKNPVKYHNFW